MNIVFWRNLLKRMPKRNGVWRKKQTISQRTRSHAEVSIFRNL